MMHIMTYPLLADANTKIKHQILFKTCCKSSALKHEKNKTCEVEMILGSWFSIFCSNK